MVRGPLDTGKGLGEETGHWGPRGAQPRLGDIWARTGEVTPDESSVSARLGKAISSMPPSDLCPWHDASIVFSAAAVLPGTLNGDIDDRYTLSSCRRYIYLQYIHGQDRVATNLDRTEKKKP